MRRLQLPAILLTAIATTLPYATPAHGALTKDQQRCVVTLNKSLAKVSKMVGKEIRGCLKDFQKEKNGVTDIPACVAADRKGKVLKATNKTTDLEVKRCVGNDKNGDPKLPGVFATDGANVNQAAVDKEAAVLAALFGSDPNATVITAAADKHAAKCQETVSKDATKCQDTLLKEFNKCKKNALKVGKDPFPAGAMLDADLVQCVFDDPKGKIAKKCDGTAPVDKIRKRLQRTCVGKGVDLGAAFPHCGCGASDVECVHACIETQVECATCQAINAADALTADCDLLDNGVADLSCASVPTPDFYVDGDSVDGIGTLADPLTVAQATNPGGPTQPGDSLVLLSSAGPVDTQTGFGGSFTLQANQGLVGQGGPVMFNGNAAHVLTLADSNTVSRITIDGTAGGANGIASSGGSGGTLSNVTVRNVAGIGIELVGTGGSFGMTAMDVRDTGGAALRISGGTASLDYAGALAQDGPGSLLVVDGGHTGAVDFTGATLSATDGDGLQFDDADGTYDFPGQTELNGGDAGIDIVGGSAGTFTFGDTTTITNPTGAAFHVVDLAAGGTIDYDGSLQNDNNVFLSIDTTAAGSQINFNTNGGNSLTSTDNSFGAIFIFDADGDITITTPTTITRPTFSALFATDGDGTWSFDDMTITDQAGLNGAIDVFGNAGTVNFTNLDITTDSAGTGDAVTGFLAGGNNEINVFGTDNDISADGGGALVLINIASIDMTFDDITSTNNLNSQIGFAGDDGIDLLSVDSGTLDVTGTTRVEDADGVGISVEDTGATVTFTTVDLDGIGRDGIISGVAFDNPGVVNINGGAVNDTGFDGARIGSTFGSGVLGGFNLNDTTFTNIGDDVVSAANSTLSGTGNVAAPFSCANGGGNVGEIFFNLGVDSCGQ